MIIVSTNCCIVISERTLACDQRTLPNMSKKAPNAMELQSSSVEEAKVWVQSSRDRGGNRRDILEGYPPECEECVMFEDIMFGM